MKPTVVETTTTVVGDLIATLSVDKPFCEKVSAVRNTGNKKGCALNM